MDKMRMQDFKGCINRLHQRKSSSNIVLKCASYLHNLQKTTFDSRSGILAHGHSKNVFCPNEHSFSSMHVFTSSADVQPDQLISSQIMRLLGGLSSSSIHPCSCYSSFQMHHCLCIKQR